MKQPDPGPSGSTEGFSLIPKIRCPYCGWLIEGPFYRAKIPVAKTHSPAGKPHAARCRVIVVPDPVGERHEVHKVHDGESKEQAMERVGRQLAA